MRKDVDLGFTPDVSRVGMLEWGAFDSAVQIGLDHARAKLAEAEQVSQPEWSHSQLMPLWHKKT